MLITPQSLADIYTGYQSAYNVGFDGCPSSYKTLAMDVTSNTGGEKYPFMNAVPQLREWLGDRIIKNLQAQAFTIENKDFESTIAVPINKIEDDQYGVFGPMFTMMGQNAKQHPDRIVYDVWSKGKTAICYDGQPFFSATHPIETEKGPIVVSNYQTGSGPSWFLIDSSRPIKPMVFQTRKPYQFLSITNPQDHHVFMKGEYLYVVNARVNAGFALWQLAACSDADLTHDNYAALRAQMIGIRKENGDKMGVIPTHLVVPAELEAKARQVVKNETRIITIEAGSPAVPQSVPISNEWAGTAEMIMTPWL